MKGGADGGGCFPTGHHYPGIAHLLRVVASGLADEVDGQTPMAEVPIVAIDTETTGRDALSDRIIELACVIYRAGSVVERHHWLIDPERPIPPDATAVHGIKDEDVVGKPKFREIAQELLGAVAGCVPLAYNATFDQGFLREELSRAKALGAEKLPPMARKSVRWLDPLTWARELQKEEKSRSLGDVCERLGIDIGTAHRATDDAEAALKVLLAFSADRRVPKGYAAFIQEQQRLARSFDDERRYWRRPS